MFNRYTGQCIYHQPCKTILGRSIHQLPGNDGTDEGICTYIGTTQMPPTCPAGTVMKSFETNILACVKTCSTSAECPRATDVCDVRFTDVMDFSNGNVIPHCVRPCELDIPDCVRSANWSRSDMGNAIAMHLFANDLSGLRSAISQQVFVTIILEAASVGWVNDILRLRLHDGTSAAGSAF